LSDQPDDAWLIALGNDVSDGKTVDWDVADRRAADPEARALLANLKRLETVIQAHRSGGAAAADTPTDADPPVTHWHHLVLFESVGSGAFGRVYRAWDTKVDREVALKLLPAGPQTARSPLSEARNLARVRHPNVVTVYGAEQADGYVGIWMEFIQGQTLAAMIRERGPMSAREVVGIGIDLCRALSALQAASLLHRDIKAHNVMREVGGRIVLMDFSGAWTSEPGEAPANVSGTPIYMAPELFEGRPPSVASDIYSLGVLLFYLLSGRLPVEGTTLAELKAAHARKARVRLRDLRPELPEAVVQVVERAVEHAPADRYQTAGELEHALVGTAGVYAAPHAELTAAVPSPGPKRRLRMWTTTAASLAVLALSGVLISGALPRPDRSPDPLLVRFQIDLPHNTSSWPRVSPDGTRVIYGSAATGQDVLWVRELGSLIGHPLPRTAARESPFWSPDSRFVAFFDDGKLKKIELAGDHQPETLASVPRARGGDWGAAGVIIFARDDGLYRINADGTGERAATTLDRARGEYSHTWPEFLPDGRRFLFVVRSTQSEFAGLYMGSLDSSARTRLMPDYSRTVYSRAGYLLFARDGALFAQGFDPQVPRLTGMPQQIAAHVKHHPGSDAAFDVSDNGVMVFRESEDLPVTRLTLVNGAGERIGGFGPIGAYKHPRFSPDGQRIVVESQEEKGSSNGDLVLFDLARGGSRRLTRDAAPDVVPAWSPDGSQIAFSSKRGSRYDVYLKTVDGSAPAALLLGYEGDKYVEDWAPSGDALLLTVQRSGLWKAPLAANAKPALIRGTASAERWLSEISPDGKWIAYSTLEGRESEVYVEALDGSGSTPRLQVSSSGGFEPHWGRDGREIFYLTADGWIASVAVTPNPDGRSLIPQKPVNLFRAIVSGPATSSNFDVTADGKRFVINTLLGYPPVPPVHVVVNWTRLLLPQTP
jgi:serine/threonine protein kinase